MLKLWKSSKSEGELQGQLELLRVQIKSLEARVNAVETDWQTTFLKLRRLYGHLTKTLAIDTRREVEAAPVPNKGNGTVSLDQLTVEEILRRPEAG